MRIFQVDAFTSTPLTGNPATVLLDADGRDEATLAAIAREFSHAEVAVVSAASAADHDVRVRFFNARKEAPFVGHATLAAHAVLLATGLRSLGVCRQLSGTGVIAVRIADDGKRIDFRQSVPELDAALPGDALERIAGAVGLTQASLHTGLPVQVARKGSTRLLIPLRHAAELDGLVPDTNALLELGLEIGVEGFFVFALEHAGAAPATQARMFCPALGIPEDPVSGNAHAMLAAYLWTHGRMGAARTFEGRQGLCMRRPGVVHVALDIHQGRLVAVHIGGRTVIVSAGTLDL